MSKRILGRSIVLVLIVLLPAALTAADNHVVSLSDLRKDVESSNLQRNRDLAAVGKLLDLDQVENALRKANLDGKQVRQAAALLSDVELARLAARASQLQNDVEAGALSNLHLTYIVIALATAVIILVIVAA